MLDRSTPPQVSEFKPLSIFPQQITELHPGITLHAIDGGTLPVNKLIVAWQYGDVQASAHATDASQTTACLASARLVPAMMLEGSAQRSGARIAEEVAFRGAWTGAGMSSDFASISLLSMNSTTPELIPVLADVLAHPTMPEQTFANMRRARAVQAQLASRQVASVAQAAVRTLLCGHAHPYGRILTADDVMTASRPLALEAASTGLRAMPVHIFVGGALSSSLMGAVHSLADNIHGMRQGTAPIIPAPPVSYSPEAPQTVHTDVPGALQGAVSIAQPVGVPRASDDYIPLRLAVMALGGYFGSRLMQNVRERLGLTYGISAALMGSAEGTAIVIDAQCDAANFGRVIAETRREMEALATQPMPDDEFRRLRQYAASQLAGTVGSPLAIADHYYSNLTIGAPADYYGRQWQALQALTPESLRDVAPRHFRPDDLLIATAG